MHTSRAVSHRSDPSNNWEGSQQYALYFISVIWVILIWHAIPFPTCTIPKDYKYPNFLIWSSYLHWCIFFSLFFTFDCTNGGFFFFTWVNIRWLWLAAGSAAVKANILLRIKLIHLISFNRRRGESDNTYPTCPRWATGCYQAVSATSEQWLNLYCSNGWDRTIIMVSS